MRQLQMTISQDENFEFFARYDKLGPIQQQIWRAAVWWCKRFPSAHPCQETLAKKVGCSREHVNRTFFRFQLWGWLTLESRGKKRAKILHIPDSLLQLDVVNRKYFKRVEITSKITHSYPSRRVFTSKTSHLAKQQKEPIKIPPLAIKMNFSSTNALKLGLVSECVVQETLYQCKKKGQAGFRPQNEESYFVGMAINIAKKRGEKLDWPAYYQQVRQ